MSKEGMISLMNYELDRRIGGIPKHSLMLMEGGYGTGKTVFLLQLCWGALNSGYRVRYISLDLDVMELLSLMERFSFKVRPYFLSGKLRLMKIRLNEKILTRKVSAIYLRVLPSFVREDDVDVTIIDPITQLLYKAREQEILTFFSKLKSLVDLKDMLICVSLHPFVISQELLMRIRGIADGDIVFSAREFRGKPVKMMEVTRLKGALRTLGSPIGFDVEEGFGIKILPFSMAKV